MATQAIVNTSAVRPRTAVLLASFALAPVVAIAVLLTATSAPATTVTAGPAEIDSLRDFRREEIGAADRGGAIDALREQRRDEFGADAP